MRTARRIRSAFDYAHSRVDRFVDEVAEYIRQNHLFQPGRRILVAVSGGLDSMVLLEVLTRLAQRKENRWRLVVGHFNHQLRGRSSQADEHLVRRRARILGWPCKVGQGNVRDQAREQGLSIEMMARQLRHTFLAEAAQRLDVSTVALAHHADDQIELFWLRLLRGAGSEGLAGMRAQTTSPINQAVRLVRPFLDRWRSELEQFAAQVKTPFREDASNRDESMLRNKIRHGLLPMLQRDYQPGLRGVLLREMTLLAAEADYLDEQARLWSQQRARPVFAALPIALQRRVVALDLRTHRVEPNFDLVELLRTQPKVPVMVAPNFIVQTDGHGRIEAVSSLELAFGEGETSVDLGLAGQLVWKNMNLRWQIHKRPPHTLRAKPGCEWFDAERVGRWARIRHWRAGDRFEPIGLGTSARLQNLFTNLKIPASERRNALLATTADGEIWWVQGLRLAERFKLRPNTRRFLEWRWEKVAKDG